MRLVLAVAGMVFLVLAFGVNQTQPFAATSGSCALSAIQVYSYATICAPDKSYVDSMLYTTSSTSTGGIWSGGSITQLGGFLKVYFLLAAGTSLSQYSLTYNTGTGSVPLTGLITGTEATSLKWFGVQLPNSVFNLNTRTTFTGTIKDSYGTTSWLNGAFTYINTGYAVKFEIYDGTGSVATGLTPALGSVQIILKVAGTGVSAGQVVTGADGKASITLPYGTYIAQPTSPAGYFSAQAQTFSSWLLPTLKWTLSKPAVITSVTLTTPTQTGCGYGGECSITMTSSNCYTNQQNGVTTCSGYTGTCYAVAGCTMTSSTTIVSGGSTTVTTTTESGTGSGGGQGSGDEKALINSAASFTFGAMGIVLLLAGIFMPGRKGGRK